MKIHERSSIQHAAATLRVVASGNLRLHDPATVSFAKRG